MNEYKIMDLSEKIKKLTRFFFFAKKSFAYFQTNILKIAFIW